jgi:formylglycine-generating enzyme required for sulfatase activity
MVPVPAGWFWMGSEAGPDNERPVHRVWVDAFELGAYQVNNAAYAVFLAATGRPAPRCWEQPQFNLPEQPVVGVSWFEAVAYCEWLSAAQGRRYRLPTEAEWERAARGGVEGRLYAWGDDPPQLLSDYALRWQEGPEPVGDLFPNPYGLYNMGDNVHEWCADWYHAEYYAASPERNPHGPEGGTRRVSRGGSWRHRVKVSRVAARSSISPAFQYADYGFRVAADIKIGG